MKSVETHPSLLEVVPAASGEAIHKDVRAQKDQKAQAGRFDALLAKAADHESAAGKRTSELKAPRPGSATDDRANTLALPARSIHDSITRTTRVVPARDSLDSKAAATARQLASTSASELPGAGATSSTESTQGGLALHEEALSALEFDDSVDGETDPQALQAVLGQVASVVAQIVAPPQSESSVGAGSDFRAGASVAAAGGAPAQAHDVRARTAQASSAQAIATSATANANPAASSTASQGAVVTAIGQSAAGASGAVELAPAPRMSAGARSTNPMFRTSAEVPAAKIKSADLSGATQAAAQLSAPATAAASASATPPTGSSAQPAGAQPAATQPAADATTGAPAQPANADNAQAANDVPAGVAKSGQAAAATSAPGTAVAGVQLALEPLTVAAPGSPDPRASSAARESLAAGKAAVAATDDRIEGFTRGALGGAANSAYAGRAQSAGDSSTSTSTPSKHALELDEQEDRDNELDAGSGFEVLPAGLPDPTLNAQLAPTPVEPQRIDAPPPTPPPAPLPTPAAPAVQVEFAARPLGSQTEAASISIHHPELGAIQLEVHRDHGRVEVHVVAESVHAEAVLRANESGIRQGVQQSGMTFSALRVRVRGEEQPTARPAQPRRRRANNPE